MVGFPQVQGQRGFATKEKESTNILLFLLEVRKKDLILFVLVVMKNPTIVLQSNNLSTMTVK